MHSVENPIGRLVAFRIHPPVSDENSARASADLRAAIVANPSAVVVVSDLRAARVFSPDTVARFVALMKSDNPKIERSAMLLGSDAATLGLQIARMVREAGLAERRRAFFQEAELLAWLEPMLSSDERVALDAFLLARTDSQLPPSAGRS
jgi:hypothetical protein